MRSSKKPTTKASISAAADAASGVLPKGKLGILVQLLSRPEGADIAELSEATGWQHHSVRGAIAGALKKRGYAVASEKSGNTRVYRIGPGQAAASVEQA